MTRIHRRTLLTLASLASLGPWAARARAAERPFVLATSTPGGGFSLYGDMLARVLNRRAGDTVLTTRMTAGTTENLALLERGEVDAALIQGTSASEILAAGADGQPKGPLRVLFAMYPSPGLLAVPAASRFRRLEDLAGRPVVFGVRTSGLVTLARQVFDGIGLDIDRDFQAIYVDQAAQSPVLVRSGKADALWGAGEGWPGFLRLVEAPGGARFIGPAPAQIERIVARWPLLKPMEVAPGSYPGIDRPLPTVGSVNLVLARADLDPTRATAFVRAMDRAAPDLGRELNQAAFSTLANTRASAPPALLHPAVVAER